MPGILRECAEHLDIPRGSGTEGPVRGSVSMHGTESPRVRKMSETRRETIERVWEEACNYYQLFEEESDRGAAVLAHSLFAHRLSEAIKSRDEAFSKDARAKPRRGFDKSKLENGVLEPLRELELIEDDHE